MEMLLFDMFPQMEKEKIITEKDTKNYLNFEQLRNRMGARCFKKRLTKQADINALAFSHGLSRVRLHLENQEFIFSILAFILKRMGHYNRGVDHGLDYHIQTHQVWIKKLPVCFDGFRILQLTDIHADAIADNGHKLTSLLTQIKVDLCVLTGDFRYLMHDDYMPCLEVVKNMVKHVCAPAGVVGILGNHDFLEMVPVLERNGVNMLINEHVDIQRNGQILRISGVDDAHMYQCDDIVKAVGDISDSDTTVLLSHTPKIYKKAYQAGVDYMLSGHTHGGQICLPNGVPIVTHAKCPRKFISGPWQYKTLQGYTSRGIGTAGMPIRFFCPPEITIHELKKG